MKLIMITVLIVATNIMWLINSAEKTKIIKFIIFDFIDFFKVDDTQ